MDAFIVWSLSYLLGSVPIGVILARTQQINIREHGSGNIGATNVARTLGKKLGVLTLLGDTLKGLAAVVLAAAVLGGHLQIAVAGLMAYLGHLFSVFLKFKGGKGVATGLGVFVYLLPYPTLCSVGVFALVLSVSKYVSLGSILAALSLPLFGAFYKTPPTDIYTAVISALLTTYKHHENIRKILAGTEASFLKK